MDTHHNFLSNNVGSENQPANVQVTSHEHTPSQLSQRDRRPELAAFSVAQLDHWASTGYEDATYQDLSVICVNRRLPVRKTRKELVALVEAWDRDNYHMFGVNSFMEKRRKDSSHTDASRVSHLIADVSLLPFSFYIEDDAVCGHIGWRVRSKKVMRKWKRVFFRLDADTLSLYQSRRAYELRYPALDTCERRMDMLTSQIFKQEKSMFQEIVQTAQQPQQCFYLRLMSRTGSGRGSSKFDTWNKYGSNAFQETQIFALLLTNWLGQR